MMTIDEFMWDVGTKMRPGWVAMNKDRTWSYFPYEPRIIDVSWWGNDYETSLSMFDIAPVDEWTKSLRKVGYENDREIELEKKLEIAVSALEWIEEQSDTSTQDDYDAEVILKNIVRDCQEALAKIKEIKGCPKNTD